MRIALIGSGRIGGKIGKLWTQAGPLARACEFDVSHLGLAPAGPASR